MQELEKILEEINEIEDEYTNEDHDIMFKLGAAGIAGDIKDIIRKHMNDGWIPVEERLPEVNEEGLSEDVYLTLENSDMNVIGFYDISDGKWYTHGSPYIGKVIAWHPCIELYDPERRKHESLV